jgi:thymidylate synthase
VAGQRGGRAWLVGAGRRGPSLPGHAAPRPQADTVDLTVYAHSLDFGKKAYGNLVELGRLQEHVAAQLGVATGSLAVHCKSAHVYEPEWAAMASIASGKPLTTLR